jgi:hypothetical protein
LCGKRTLTLFAEVRLMYVLHHEQTGVDAVRAGGYERFFSASHTLK